LFDIQDATQLQHPERFIAQQTQNLKPQAIGKGFTQGRQLVEIGSFDAELVFKGGNGHRRGLVLN
jgi:hypothetical protein